MADEMRQAKEVLTEILGKLSEMQSAYDSQLLATATLAFTADLHSLLLKGGVTRGRDIGKVFARAMYTALDESGDKPKIIYGDTGSGRLQ